MPGYNGTEPLGKGPMTGRKMRRCAGNQQETPGAGNGRGCGRGFRNRFFAAGKPGWMTVTANLSEQNPETEKEILVSGIAMMKVRLAEAEQRLKELSAK